MTTKVLMPKKATAYQGRNTTGKQKKPDRGVECWVVWDETIWPSKVTKRRYEGPYQEAPNAPSRPGFQAMWIRGCLRYRLTKELVLEIPAIDLEF